MEEDEPSFGSELTEDSRFRPQSETSSCNSISNPYYDGPQAKSSERKDASSKDDRQQQTRRCLTFADPDTRTIKNNEVVVIACDLSYLRQCGGVLCILQILMSLATLICLVTSGRREGGLLNLPLSWHFRIMLFVLVLTFMTSLLTAVANITSLVHVFPFQFSFLNVLLYSLFAFLYLVASSLVASAFDFFDKIQTGVSAETIHQLAFCVVLGYVTMVIYGATAFLNYRQWKVAHRIYQRRKLLEEDDIDI